MDTGRCLVKEGVQSSLLAQGNIYGMLVWRQTGYGNFVARLRGDDDKPSAALEAEVTACLTTDSCNLIDCW